MADPEGALIATYDVEDLNMLLHLDGQADTHVQLFIGQTPYGELNRTAEPLWTITLTRCQQLAH